MRFYGVCEILVFVNDKNCIFGCFVWVFFLEGGGVGGYDIVYISSFQLCDMDISPFPHLEGNSVQICVFKGFFHADLS